MMTKAFIVFNQGLWNSETAFIDNKKLWYDDEKAMEAFPLLKELKAAKLTAAKAKTVSDRSSNNKRIKDTISRLEGLTE